MQPVCMMRRGADIIQAPLLPILILLLFKVLISVAMKTPVSITPVSILNLPWSLASLRLKPLVACCAGRCYLTLRILAVSPAIRAKRTPRCTKVGVGYTSLLVPSTIRLVSSRLLAGSHAASRVLPAATRRSSALYTSPSFRPCPVSSEKLLP